MWILLAIISALTLAITRIIQKILLSPKNSDSFAFGFIYCIGVSIIFTLYTFGTNSFEFPVNTPILLHILLMSVLYAAGNICMYTAFSLAQASEVAVILTTGTVWSVLTSVLFLKETLVPFQILGILFVIVGVVVVNYQKSQWKIQKGHIYSLFAAFLYGIAFTNDAFILTQYKNVAPYMILAFGLPAIITIFAHPSSIKQVHVFLQRNNLILYLTGISMYAISAICIFNAFKMGGPASIISPLQQTTTLFTILFGYLILKERNNLAQKIIGGVFVFGGALLLV